MEGCMGEESFQMWELNRRLEAYLARVKALEEQNEVLSAELGGLRAQSADASWRARADDELAALRALVDQRWREKHAAEVERDNLAEELESVAGRCQQLRLARERTAEEAARSRRAIEAEKCARGWLSTQAAELERELEAMRAAHDEERASLNAQAACAPRVPARPRGPPAPAPEVEELARRLGEAWRGAVRGYQERVAHMETSLGQARERLGKAVQGAREGRLELQQLQAERSGLQERRDALEQRLEGRWQERLRATEKFQLAVEALEQERQGLQSQIAQVLEGRQQLAHLKMSLSLEVATYRTLLEAENSRLQTPGGNSKASLGFQDPKLEPHFPGTPEGRRLGPLLPVLSPTPLPSPLPNTLETPVPAFLKSQEFLQARTPTLASTPIPPTPQASRPAINAEARAQDAPISLLQPQGFAEAKVAVPDSILPGPEEPGGRQQEASPGQSPEDQASSSAPPLSLEHSSLEAKDGDPSVSIVSSIFQEEHKGQIWGLVEKEAAVEVKVVRHLQQKTWQEEEDLHMKQIQDSEGPLEKDTLKALGAEMEEPQMSLENQSYEILEKECQESLRSLEEENLEKVKILEKGNHELLKSLEKMDLEVKSSPEKEAPEPPKPVGKEDSETLRSSEKENGELMMSLEGTPETVSFPGKENQELARSLEEQKFESLRNINEENQQPLRSEEAEDQETCRSQPKENQEFLRALEDENQETFRPLEKENQEPLRSVEEDPNTVRPLEKETQQPLRSLEEDQKITRPLEKETQDPLRSLEEEDLKVAMPPEKDDQEPLRSLEEEDQKIMRPLEKENQEPLRSLEEEDLKTVMSPEKDDQEPLRSLEEEALKVAMPPEKDDQEPLRSLEEEDQKIMRPLEKENQEPLRSLEEEDLKIVMSPEKENQEPLRSLEEEDLKVVMSPEKENQEPLRSLEEEDLKVAMPPEKDDQEPLRSLEEEDQNIGRPLEKETPQPLQSLEEEDQKTIRPLEKENHDWSSKEENQETMGPLEKETQQPPMALGDEEQMTLRSLEQVNPEPLKSLGKDQEIDGSPEKDNQELSKSLKEESVEAVKSLETDNVEALESAEENAETSKSLETQAPLLSLEEMNREIIKPLEEEIEAPVGSVEETLRPLEKENQEPLRSLGEWDLENVKFPEEAEKQNQRDLEEEERLEKGEDQESLRLLGEEGQELPQATNQQRWEDMALGDQELNQETHPGRAGVGNEDEAELDPREQNGTEEAAQLQRVPAEGATEGLQAPVGQLEQVVTPGQGMPEVTQPTWEGEDEAQGAEQASPEVTLGSVTARGESAVGAQLALDQEVIGLGDPGHGAREEAVQPPPGEECLEAKPAQVLQSPGKEPEEADVLGASLSEFPRTSRDPLTPPKGWEESEPKVPLGTEKVSMVESSGTSSPQPRAQGSEEIEGSQPVLGPPSPRPTEPWLHTPNLEDAPGPQPQAKGTLEADRELEGRAEAPRKVEEEFGAGEISEGLQEEGEESREESEAEADELGETLPDSTPLGLYLQSPASPRWDMAGEQRPSPQGEARKEGWNPTALVSEGLGAQPSEEEEEEEGEEEEKEEEEEEEEGRGHDSDLSEEFEDLVSEASLLPGDPKEVAEPLDQVPQMLKPEVWDGDGESDGFADEEESGEEGEEEEEDEGEGREPGAPRWGPGSSASSLQALSSSQRGDDLEPETVAVGVPWDDSLRASVTALDTESQDSAEPSDSEEESDSVPVKREDQVSGPLETPRGVEDLGPGAGDTFGVNGGGPNLEEESEHMNGKVMNGLEQSQGMGQGTLGAPDGDRGIPFQEEEGGALKTPWGGAPLHLGPGQFLKFTPREGEGDSWSSEED